MNRTAEKEGVFYMQYDMEKVKEGLIGMCEKWLGNRRSFVLEIAEICNEKQVISGPQLWQYYWNLCTVWGLILTIKHIIVQKEIVEKKRNVHKMKQLLIPYM